MRSLLCLAALAVTGCAGGARASAPAARAVSLPAGMTVPQVLSLSVDPADGALFTATDGGLLRIARDGRRATRIGGTYEGVTLRRDSPVEFVGPGQLLGSGHPAKASYKLPDDLGLLLSDDTGRTWQSVGLIGEADLHLLHPAGRRLWAYDLVGQTFVLTRDG